MTHLLEQIDALAESGARELAVGSLAQAHDVFLLLLHCLPKGSLVLTGPQHADLKDQCSLSIFPLLLHQHTMGFSSS